MTKDVNQHLAQFQFKDYAFTDMCFRIHDGYRQTMDETPLRIKIGARIALPDEEELIDTGGVELSCAINDDEQSKIDTLFEMNVVMRGQFLTNERLPRDQMKHFLQVNGVTAMFPFLRAAISSLSTTGNVPTVILPMINVHSLMKGQEPEF